MHKIYKLMYKEKRKLMKKIQCVYNNNNNKLIIIVNLGIKINTQNHLITAYSMQKVNLFYVIH